MNVAPAMEPDPTVQPPAAVVASLIPDQPEDSARLDDAGVARYAALADRAVEFIRRRGVRIHEDALVSHVFGNAGHPELWRPLLRRVLATEAGLSFHPDGFWALAGDASGQSSQVLDEYIAVDVETTGLRPVSQRIIEVAAIRFRNGTAADRFESMIFPEKGIPAFISKLTGITNEHVADAPRFGEVAEPLLDFVGSTPLVGHNVSFDLGFINAELKRLALPAFGNQSIDTLALANKLLPGLRKPTLERVARTLGIEVRGLHRAGKDAMLTGLALLALLDQARQQGYEGDQLQDLLSARNQRQGKSREGRSRAPLDRSLLASIPKAPGVYLMRDRFGHVIYVGKAKNLRDRVGSYFSQPVGYTRKMDGLLESLTTIDTEVTGSELEALLLEAQLIRRYSPRYNTALRSFEHYPYIRVDLANPWPRVTISKERKDDGAVYFGPFRNKSGARKTVDLINNVLPLRTCTRSFKDARSYGSPCIQLDLGRWLGPCMGKANAGDYRAHVYSVVRFLDGDDDALYEELWRGLETAAARHDYERAAKLRDDLQTVTQVVSSHRIMRDAALAHTLLLVLPSARTGCREILMVLHGRLWAQFRASCDDPRDLEDRLCAAWSRCQQTGIAPVDQNSVDDTNILNRWLHQYAGHPAILPFDHGDAPPWRQLSCAALALDDEDLTVTKPVTPAHDDKIPAL